MHLDHVRIPIRKGKLAEKTKGRSLDVLSGIMKSIVAVKVAFLCLAHALIIAIAQVNDNPKYALYRQGKYIKTWRRSTLQVWIYLMAKALKNFNSFRSTFRTIKLLCLMN